jgi:hypothetical protein
VIGPPSSSTPERGTLLAFVAESSAAADFTKSAKKKTQIARNNFGNNIKFQISAGPQQST